MIPAARDHSLVRGLGFWSALAINVTQVVGAGVFVTIPLILKELPGAYGLLAWLTAGVLILCDGMIWAELGAALPSAGGSYHFLRESYGRHRWGRLMSFLFVWQMVISGPLKLASGLVIIDQFSTGLSPEFQVYDAAHTWTETIDIGADDPLSISLGPSRAIGLICGLVIITLLYRRVTALGKLSLVFLLAVFAVIGWVLVEGALHFDPALAFAVPAEGEGRPPHLSHALGASMSLAIFAYLGYYNICYLGSEVREPARTIPRSILTSVLAVIVLFILVQLAITGVVPTADAVAAKNNLTGEFMTRVSGPAAALAVTACLIVSSFASVFAGMLGYSRIPYAAAREGHFFSWFAAVHPRHFIPHRSLLLIGGLTLFWSFFSLDAIIFALIATRILEQFVAQIFAVILLRRAQRPMPWRMWFYPLPCGVALAGWLFVYFNTGTLFILIGAGTLLAGAAVFLFRSKQSREWPCAQLNADAAK